MSNRWHSAQALQSLGGIKLPVLLLHGAKDTLIPASHSQALYTACASTAKHLVIIDYADHNYFEAKDLIKYVTPLSSHHLACPSLSLSLL